jgi:hypothetical protein
VKPDIDAIMLAVMRGDAKVLAKAVPELIAYVRDLEARLKEAEARHLALHTEVVELAHEARSITDQVMDAFPGSKLTGSQKR